MKNLSLGLNALLIVAVAILYYMHFSEPNSVNEEIIDNKCTPLNSTDLHRHVKFDEGSGTSFADETVKCVSRNDASCELRKSAPTI